MARPLTEKEKKILRTFHRQVDRLRQSTIVQSGKVSFKYTTRINFPSGQSEMSFEGYDKVAFQAQLPILRQFMLKKDDINFFKVQNVLKECCDRAELLPWIDYALRDWTAVLAQLPNEEHRYFHGAQLTVDEAVEKLFYGYGGLFHADINDPAEEDAILEIQEATLQFAFPRLWNSVHILDSVIYLWLDAPSEPVPPLPTK